MLLKIKNKVNYLKNFYSNYRILKKINFNKDNLLFKYQLVFI